MEVSISGSTAQSCKFCSPTHFYCEIRVVLTPGKSHMGLSRNLLIKGGLCCCQRLFISVTRELELAAAGPPSPTEGLSQVHGHKLGDPLAFCVQTHSVPCGRDECRSSTGMVSTLASPLWEMTYLPGPRFPSYIFRTDNAKIQTYLGTYIHILTTIFLQHFNPINILGSYRKS